MAEKNAAKTVRDFLVKLLSDEDADMRDRLKASELLAKTDVPRQTESGVSSVVVKVDYGGKTDNDSG